MLRCVCVQQYQVVFEGEDPSKKPDKYLRKDGKAAGQQQQNRARREHQHTTGQARAVAAAKPKPTVTSDAIGTAD